MRFSNMLLRKLDEFVKQDPYPGFPRWWIGTLSVGWAIILLLAAIELIAKNFGF